MSDVKDRLAVMKKLLAIWQKIGTPILRYILLALTNLLQWALGFYGGNVLWGLLVVLNSAGSRGLTPIAIAHTMLLDWAIIWLQISSSYTVWVILGATYAYVATFALSIWVRRRLSGRNRTYVDTQDFVAHAISVVIETRFPDPVFLAGRGEKRDADVQYQRHARTIMTATKNFGLNLNWLLTSSLPLLISVIAGAVFSILIVHGGLGATTGWLRVAALGALVSLGLAVVVYLVLAIWNRLHRPEWREE